MLANTQNGRGSTPCYSAETGLKQKFTGKERDPESRLDYFGARYFSWAQGRFTSPDEPLVDQGPEDPQSWNLYAYTRNNPLAFVDTNGNIVATVTGALAGGVIGGTIELWRGGNFFRGAATGALAGAISGSVIDTGGASLGVLALAGAAGGVGGGVFDRAFSGQGTSLGDVAVDATIGAAAGVAGGLIGKGLTSLGQKLAGPSSAFETLRPGPHAGESIQASGTGISAGERQAVNQAGAQTGCHNCGSKIPGTKSGNWIGDHQPASGSLHTGPQSLYPHCTTCSARQGAQVRLQNQQWQSQQRIGAATGASTGAAVRKRKDDDE
ncbi:MAG: RHS repeat-associated core domain-containing protein [Terriglobia bacterium]